MDTLSRIIRLQFNTKPYLMTVVDFVTGYVFGPKCHPRMHTHTHVIKVIYYGFNT